MGKRLRNRIISIIVLLVLALSVALSAGVYADESNPGYVAHSETDGTTYNSIDAAWQAARSGKTIVMDADWKITSVLELNSDEKATIKMNNHYIDRGRGGRIFSLGNSSELNLIGDEANAHEFSYARYYGNTTNLTTKAGGFLTGGKMSKGDGGAIWMSYKSKLTLENIGLMGNATPDGNGGAIYMSAKSSITMKNSRINDNVSDYYSKVGGFGGAIDIQGEGCNIDMTNSAISGNYARHRGAGIYSSGDSTTITMKNNSEINNNWSCNYGAGIYFNNSLFKITGDGTAKMNSNGNHYSANSSADGGAIGMNSVWFGENEGLIEGISFDGNDSGGSGGAIAINQEGVTVRNCKFISNKARTNNFTAKGGAIYVNNDHATIENCTFDKNFADGHGGAIYVGEENVLMKNCSITNNQAGYGGGIYINNDDNTIENCTITDNSAGNEGGGIFVNYTNDINLKGKIIVKDNGRTYGMQDNMFLDSNSINTIWAYAIGNVDAGSSIGIRTGVTGDRRLVKSLTNYIEGTFFIDNVESYYISYSSSDKQLYQRKGALKYLITVNGQGSTRYDAKTNVTVSDNNTDKSKAFKCWSDESTGINLTGDQKTSSSIQFAMPGNDVHLKAKYMTRIKNVQLVVSKPEAGSTLPETGELSWIDLDTYEYLTKSVPITWEIVDDDEKTTTVSGKAKYNTSYKVRVDIEENAADGLAFASKLESAKIYIGGDEQLDQASVDSYSGMLSMTSKSVVAEKAKITSVDSVSITVAKGKTYDQLLLLLPDYAVATLGSGEKTGLRVDKENAILPSEDMTKVEVPIICTEGIDNSDEIKLLVNVTEADNASEEVPTPVVDKGADTYQGNTVSLNVTRAEGCKVYYQIDDGEIKLCDENEITLTGEENKKTVLSLSIWAVKDGVKSDVLSYSYVLDDVKTSGENTVKITCRDTGAAQGEDAWKDSKSITCDGNYKVNIVAPNQEGRVFDYWEWGEVPDGFDKSKYDISKSVINIDSLSENIELIAVYNPAVSELNLTMDEPEGGKTLPSSIVKIMAKFASDEGLKDVTNYFVDSSGTVDFTWSPEGKDGKADYDTTYTATIPLNRVGSQSGVKYVLSRNLKVKVNDEESGATAHVTEQDSKYVLCVSFKKTDKLKLKEVTAPEDVNISFEEARLMQEAQEKEDDKGSGKNCWKLLAKTGIILENDSTDSTDITWEIPQGFDEKNLSEQTLTVRGTAGIPSYIDANNVSTDVSLKIHIASPEKTATPTADIAEGTYNEIQYVTLNCDTSEASIYYTLDGTTPTADSTLYDGEVITVDKSLTLKAVAIGKTMKSSDVASYDYVIDLTPTPTPEPTPTPTPAPTEKETETETKTEAKDEESTIKLNTLQASQIADESLASEETNGDAQVATSAETGDTTNTLIYVAIAVLASFAVAGIVFVRKVK